MKHSAILTAALFMLFLGGAVAQNAATPVNAKATKTMKSINWVTFDEAQELQKKEPRQIIMDIYTPWCGPCKMMMRNTFTNPDVIDYINANFYAVKFNGEGPDATTWKGKKYENVNYDPNRSKNARNNMHSFTRAMTIRGYPTLIFFDAETNVIKQAAGYQTPDRLMPLMKDVQKKGS